MATCALALALTGCGVRAHQYELQAMSTLVRVTVYARRAPQWPGLAAAAARFAAVYDHRLATSPVAAINRGERVAVDSALDHTLATALDVAARSEGAFDPTVLPLTALWGFDAGGALPGEQALQAARAQVDFRRLRLVDGVAYLEPLSPPPDDPQPGAAPTAGLDLGGIGKGAVVDQLADWLVERGQERFLIEAGGDVLVAGLKPGDVPWRIWVRHPRQGDIPLTIATIGRAGGRVALVTSGDYERYFEADGRRYHHILDPRTGYPAAAAVSVTVIAASAIEADALATALFVMGAAGLELLDDDADEQAIIVTTTDGVLEAAVSDGFPALGGQVNLN